ncbi:hypothetical protein DPMN_024989 [Dreissena polymorpha]|uniref:Uncharacterized protein n=1 Tax=Dreissena polymorpha TaxID=45954 RepID=A0A9D4RC55_DREPO|nr:hypothetical protein DPMN_024989 [Dreissena polymorpha]
MNRRCRRVQEVKLPKVLQVILRHQAYPQSDSSSVQTKADEAIKWMTIYLGKSQNHPRS